MKRIYVLNACDEWKSYSSFSLYGIWASSKAGTRRLINALIKGIKDGYFAYDDESADVEEQIESLREDAKTDCNSLYYLLRSKLVYGSISLEEVR